MVYNGEVFNHYELRTELEARGERFRTTSDTEILLRLIDRDGPAALDACNGQWAIAHVDRPSRTLTLMRDRFGVRPLHYALLPDGGIVFSSEVKGILASGLVEATPDLEGIDEVFTLWAARPPRTAFKGDPPAPARPPARVARRRDRGGAPLVGAALRDRRAGARARGARRAAARLACGCGCAPTSRSAATSRAASTRASRRRSRSSRPSTSCARSRSPSATRCSTSRAFQRQVAERARARSTT